MEGITKIYLENIVLHAVHTVMSNHRNNGEFDKNWLGKDIFIYAEKYIIKREADFSIETKYTNEESLNTQNLTSTELDEKRYVYSLILKERNEHKEYKVSEFYVKYKGAKYDIYSLLNTHNAIELNRRNDNPFLNTDLYDYCLIWVLGHIKIKDIFKFLDYQLTLFRNKEEMNSYLDNLISHYKEEYTNLFPKENLKRIKKWSKNEPKESIKIELTEVLELDLKHTQKVILLKETGILDNIIKVNNIDPENNTHIAKHISKYLNANQNTIRRILNDYNKGYKNDPLLSEENREITTFLKKHFGKK